MSPITAETLSVQKAEEPECAKVLDSAQAVLSEGETTLSDVAEMEVDCSSQEAAEVSETDLPASFQRTESLTQRQLQLQAVVRRLEDHQMGLRQLAENTSLLVGSIAKGIMAFQEVNQMLLECRKTARNLEEDLLDDTLGLDKLTRLSPEDRSKRKTLISRLDALLEDVDKVKSDLAAAETNRNAILEDTEQQVPSELTDMCATSDESEKDDATEPGCQISNALQRTESQVQKQAHVQDLAQQLDCHKLSMQRLREKVSRLASRLKREDAHLEDENKMLEDCRKEVRNQGEDFLEVIVALDKLSGLFADDRRKRKEMIASLDVCLEEVDAIKSDLVSLEKDAHAKINSEAKMVAAQKAANAAPEIPVLGSDFWERLPLPVQFRSFEETDCYTLLAPSCNLRAQEIHLQLGPDASSLIVSGTHLPSAAELGDMKGSIAQHISQVGKQSCCLSVVQALYIELGNGCFGRFSKSFKLPRDVDVRRIEASCDEGVLRVRLPKDMRQARRTSCHPFLSGRPLPSGW